MNGVTSERVAPSRIPLKVDALRPTAPLPGSTLSFNDATVLPSFEMSDCFSR